MILSREVAEGKAASVTAGTEKEIIDKIRKYIFFNKKNVKLYFFNL